MAAAKASSISTDAETIGDEMTVYDKQVIASSIILVQKASDNDVTLFFRQAHSGRTRVFTPLLLSLLDGGHHE